MVEDTNRQPARLPGQTIQVGLAGRDDSRLRVHGQRADGLWSIVVATKRPMSLSAAEGLLRPSRSDLTACRCGPTLGQKLKGGDELIFGGGCSWAAAARCGPLSSQGG